MGYYDNEIAKIDKILAGKFADPKDAAYWVNRKAELQRKNAISIENQKYFRKMRKYDR